jgi:hypothetical protein
MGPTPNHFLLPIQKDDKTIHPVPASNQAMGFRSRFPLPGRVQSRQGSGRVAGPQAAAAAVDVIIHLTNAVTGMGREERELPHHTVKPIRRL